MLPPGINSVSRETLAALSGDTMDRLGTFVRLVLHWNRSINLLGRSDEALIWDRHVTDALQLGPLIPGQVTRAIDIGSGGGFPALVLSLVHGLEWDLVEADHRKAAFLREAARLTRAPVRVHAARAEQVGLVPAALVTARAFAPLDRLLSVAGPLLAPGGLCLLPKGREVGSELTNAQRRWHMRVEQVASRTSPDGVILAISELRPVGQPS